MRSPLAIAPLTALALAAAASPGALRAEVERDLEGRARLDWTRAMLVAVGAAPGDVRAPSAELARVKAERGAREAARERLVELARELPLAGGETVGEALEDDRAAARRLERAAGRSLDLDVDYASDGSVVLTSGLPLEAVRLAVSGAPAPPPGPLEEAPTALVVDARGHLSRPLLGLRLRAGEERWAGPTVFHRRPREARRDRRLGPRVRRVEARGYRDGTLVLEEDAPLRRARRAGALVVVIIQDEPQRKEPSR